MSNHINYIETCSSKELIKKISLDLTYRKTSKKPTSLINKEKIIKPIATKFIDQKPKSSGRMKTPIKKRKLIKEYCIQNQYRPKMIIKDNDKPQQLKLSLLFSKLEFNTFTNKKLSNNKYNNVNKTKREFSFDNDTILPNNTYINKKSKESIQLDKLTIECCLSPDNNQTISDQSPIKKVSPFSILNSLNQTPEHKISFFDK